MVINYTGNLVAARPHVFLCCLPCLTSASGPWRSFSCGSVFCLTFFSRLRSARVALSVVDISPEARYLEKDLALVSKNQIPQPTPSQFIYDLKKPVSCWRHRRSSFEDPLLSADAVTFSQFFLAVGSGASDGQWCATEPALRKDVIDEIWLKVTNIEYACRILLFYVLGRLNVKKFILGVVELFQRNQITRHCDIVSK